MHEPNTGGHRIRQDPRQTRPSTQAGGRSASQPAAFLNLRQAAGLLGVSERKFHELRVQGLVPEPLNLGPRALRWPRDELLFHVAEHAPRGGQPAPEQLTRGRIEKMRRVGAE